MRAYMKVVVLGIVFGSAWLIVKGASAFGPVGENDLPPTDLERVAVGSMAPDFSLEDEHGNAVTLSQFRSKKNVVLVFYRGHW